MTLHKILPLSLLALSLSACGILSQQPAPVETATPTTVQPVATNNNPYGVAPQDDMPYTPPAATPAPVQPAPVSGSTYTPPNSTYIPSNAPVDPNATTHTVVYGDTVYNLSKRYNINADELRSLNNIVDNNITIGQVLRLPNRGAVTAPVATPVAPAPVTPAPVVAPTAPAAAPVVSGSMRQVGGVTWSRPTNGQIFSNFGGTNKGVKYSGQSGQPIYAAADGEVKYSGSGLRGYGNLLIIQHNSKYLTAYGNNATIMVKEGQKVKRGQQIATMGNTDATQTQLHFEVRENGNAVDPTKFVP